MEIHRSRIDAEDKVQSDRERFLEEQVQSK
jgi:hypothetical protein